MPNRHGNWCNWAGTTAVQGLELTCGHCGNKVGPTTAYTATVNFRDQPARILICPVCSFPTFIHPNGVRCPAPLHGRAVRGISDDEVAQAYFEACVSSGSMAYTGSVMLCRKILMNVAVAKGADENMKFVEYVEFLNDSGYIPPEGRAWVEFIKNKGNEANHEIPQVTQNDAEKVLGFTQMLLRFVYEMPSIMNDEAEDRGRTDLPPHIFAGG